MSTPLDRRCYADDPTLEDRVFALLETWFVGISARRNEAARLGSRWEDCSTPYVHEEKGQIVSHVGLIEMPYVVHGQRHRFGGIHGVCTHASARRRGHFRRLMEALLEDCEGRYETLELSTENPEYYEPFGFRVVPEHRFVANVAHRSGRTLPLGSVQGFQSFDASQAGAVERLDRLLRERTPVSSRVGLVEELDVFKFSNGSDGLHYSSNLDCFAVYEIAGTRLVLSDLVARELPSLDDLLTEVAGTIESVEFHFSPDRFDVETRSELFRYDRDVFMVRGPFAAEGEAFMVPPPARH
jgi:ribosomal protein S18 acetylase RimI-like enzyme